MVINLMTMIQWFNYATLIEIICQPDTLLPNRRLATETHLHRIDE